jgi:hypothetical protein
VTELYDVSLHFHARTAKAFLVSENGDRDKAVWLPVSQIKISDWKASGSITVTAPTWLLIEKGLL